MAKISSKKTSPVSKKVFLHGMIGSGFLLTLLLMLTFVVFASLHQSSGFDLKLPAWAQSSSDEDKPSAPSARAGSTELLPTVKVEGTPERKEAQGQTLLDVTRGLEENPAAAIAALKRYLGEHPKDPDTLFQIALLESRKLQNPEAALPYLFEALASDKSNPIYAHEALHTIMNAKGTQEKQLESLDQLALLQAGASEEIKHPLAQAYLALGEKDKAFEQMEQALQLAPESAPGLYEDAAQVTYEKGSYDRALVLIDQALEQQTSEEKDFFTLVKKIQILAALERRNELKDLLQELEARTIREPQNEKIVADLRARYNS